MPNHVFTRAPLRVRQRLALTSSRGSRRRWFLWSTTAVLTSLGVLLVFIERERPQGVDAIGLPQLNLKRTQATQSEPRAGSFEGDPVEMAYDRLEKVISDPPSGLEGAAEAFEQLLKGEVRGVAKQDRNSIRAITAELTRGLSRTEIANCLAQCFGIPREAVMAQEDPSEMVVEFVDALIDHSTPDPVPAVLVVTEECAPDGRLIGKAHVISTGVNRVYAVFENKRSLAGRDEVLTVWRNLGDERLVFTQTEPIHVDTQYNFVWLELENGWPAGCYRVDLYDPAHPTRKLASEAFSVR